MSVPNSGMTIHTLVLMSDRFSLHCNSIHSTVSIVHLRAISSFLIPLLRVYIKQHSSNAIQFNFIHVQQCIQISTRINSSMYIHTSFICPTLRSAMVCWPIIQHGVRIEAVFASLQQGEHMVKSTAVSCIHPDKYNNSVDRIISKEEERRSKERYFSLVRVQWCFRK